MLYRAEIVVNGEVTSAKTYTNGEVTQPRQAMRRIIKAAEAMEEMPERFGLYVMNGHGEVWAYAMRRKNGSYEAEPVRVRNNPLPKDMVSAVLAGMHTVYEVTR